MKKHKIARLNSYRRLSRLLQENAAIFQDFEKLQNEADLFESQLNSLESYAMVQTSGSTPITILKDEKFEALEELCTRLCGKAWVWAMRTGHSDLAEIFRLNSADFRVAEAELLIVVQNIHSLMVENKLSLSDYHITQANLDAFLNVITEARRMKDEVGSGKARRSNAGQNIDELQRDMEQTLDFIQTLVKSEYALSHPDFVNTFALMRRVEDPATRHTTLQGTVKDAEGNAIAAAVCRLAEADDLSATSDTEGRYELKTFKGGQYTLHVTRTGYQPFEQALTIGVGDTRTVDVILTPAA